MAPRFSRALVGKCILKRSKQVFGETVNVTTEGKRHLGAVIGSKSNKDQYCMKKVNVWRGELETLAEIAETEPQAAYAAYTKGYKSKFTFFLRTIEDFEEYLEPVDCVLFDKLIPNLFGGSEPDVPKEPLALNANDGGIGIKSQEQRQTSRAC